MGEGGSLQARAKPSRLAVRTMSLLAEDASVITSTTTKTTSDATATAKSLFVLALHAWTLCVLVVVLVALLLLAPVAIVIVFPVVCMAASLYLLCKITAWLLAPFLLQPDWTRDQCRGGVRESRKQDCVEIDRAEAPGGFSDGASSAEEEPGERSEHVVGRHEFSCGDEEGFGDYCHGERRRFFFVDTYYKSFYDLLAFWRSLERGQWR